MVANRRYGAKLLAIVLKRYNDIHLSQELLAAAVNGNERGYGEVFDLILEPDANTEVSEDTLKAAAANTSSGVGIFSAILSHKEENEVNEGTLKTAAGNTWGADIFSVILSHNGEIEISDDALKAAISIKWDGSDIFRAILNHKKNVVISKNLIGAIAEDDHCGRGIMNELMDHGNCEIKLDSKFESLEETMRSSRQHHYYRCKFAIPRK